MLFKAAITVVNTLDKDGRSVVVHCSDGWDRTTQIVALAELLLDPYYRTIEVIFDLKLLGQHLRSPYSDTSLTKPRLGIP
jgi:protein tyrosine/serine phosphatase